MNYRPEIDGLRALAVLPVILFHAGIGGFEGGFVGVDVFFVISGYLNHIDHPPTEPRRQLFDSGLLRASREAHLARVVLRDGSDVRHGVVLVAATGPEKFWPKPRDGAGLRFQHLVLSAGGLLRHCLGVKAAASYVESRRGGAVLLALSCLHASCLAPGAASDRRDSRCGWPGESRDGRGDSGQSPILRFLFVARAFLGDPRGGRGAALYLFNPNRDAGPRFGPRTRQVGSALGLLLLVYANVAFNRATPFPSLYALVPTLGAACIVLFSDTETFVGKLLATRPLVGIGLISYSAYLWHQPMFALARHRSLTEPTDGLLLGLAVLSLVFAYFSWRFVEAPFRGRKRVSNQQLWSFAVVGSALFVGLGAAAHLTSGAPGRFDAQTLAILAAQRDMPNPPPHCDPKANAHRKLGDLCAMGAEAAPTGILIGDSHAQAFASSLSNTLRDGGVNFVDGTYPGCSPVLSPRQPTHTNDDCLAFNRAIQSAVIKDGRIAHVVLLLRWTMGLDGIGKNLDGSGPHGNGFDNEEGGIEYLIKPPDPSMMTVAERGRRERAEASGRT